MRDKNVEAKAFVFAYDAHDGQYRKNNKNKYISHPIMVYKILMGVTEDTTILAAALLHDVLEDTKLTYEELKSEFGHKIAYTVKQVTKDKKGDFTR